MEEIFQLKSQDEFEVAIDKILCNLFMSKISGTNKMIEAAIEDLKLMFLNHGYNTDKVIQDLELKYSGNQVKILIKKMEALKSDILYCALINHNAMYGKCITDFDWTVKLVLGTSALKTLRYPLLQLILNSTDSSSVQQTKVFDMKKSELEKLINVLESVDL